jgi:hypothetical protein
MSERWTWVIRYVLVIIMAVVLAAALGATELFRTTRLGRTGLNASRVVEFLGYGGALLVFWLLAQRAARLLPAKNSQWDLAKNALVPLATLIVIACGQAALLLIVGPFMNATWRQAYNWAVIAAIILAAGWLVMTLFTGSSSLAPLLGNHGDEPHSKRQGGG